MLYSVCQFLFQTGVYEVFGGLPEPIKLTLKKISFEGQLHPCITYISSVSERRLLFVTSREEFFYVMVGNITSGKFSV